MLIFILVLPLIVALLCLALSNRVPARWLGIAAATALFAGGVALLSARVTGQLPLVLVDRTWLALDDRTFKLTIVCDAANWGFVMLALGGGGMALLALALAVPPNVRGFGGLFAAALLTLTAVAAGLANRDATLLPFLWALAALLIFLALRASGALAGSDAPVIVLIAGLGGALLAIGAVLAMSVAPLGGGPLALIAWTLAGMLALGALPFHAPTQSLAQAPAALAGALLAPIINPSPDVGAFPAIKSYVIVVLGGMGSIWGAMAAALLLGVAESFFAVYVSYDYRDTFGLLILIAVLIFRPQGLLGERAREL